MKNVLKYPETFHPLINMWVHEEMVDRRKLTEIINEEHENPKYLPGYTLPENVFADPDVESAIADATIFVFCLPHQFLQPVLDSIKKVQLLPNAIAVSLIKGIEFDHNGIKLISQMISKSLGLDCSVLMGANVASEVAAGQFCESTLGCFNLESGAALKLLFNAENFHVDVVLDPYGAEMCGGLKNVIALGAGFCDGLGYGGNTKAAIIRNGLIEMKKFCFRFLHGIKEDTFFESCGIADLITTCYGGRNRRCAEQFARTGKSWEELENSLLNGQKLQGTSTLQEIHKIIAAAGCQEEFPLITAIHRIAYENAAPETITQFMI